MPYSRIFLIVLFFLLPVLGTAQTIEMADSLRLKGEQLHEGGKFREAETYYRKAYDLYRQLQDTAGWLQTGQYYAEVMGYQSKYEDAFDLLGQLQVTSHPANNNSFKARTQQDLAWMLRRQGKQQEALEHYNRGLSLAEQAQDSLMIAYLLLGAGGVYYNMDNYSRALEMRKKVLPYFEGLGNMRGYGMALNNIGRIYDKLNLLDEAYYYFSESLKIFQQIGEVNLLASSYSNLGDTYKRMGNYTQALIAYNKGLEYRKQAGDRLLTAVTLNDIGVLYGTLGDDEKALEYYLECLKIDRDIASPQSLAVTYRNIGNKLWALGKQSEAISYFEEALELTRKAGTPRAIAESLLMLVKVENETGDHASALARVNEVSAIADSTSNDKLMVDSFKWRGIIAQAQENPEEALYYYRQSYALSQTLPGKIQINLLQKLAHIHDRLGSDSALVYGQKAIDIIEKERSSAGAMTELKASYFGQHSDFYIDMALWTLKYEQSMENAYALMESSKARVLAEELSRPSNRTSDQLPEDVRIERALKRNRLDELYSRLDQVQSPEEYAALETDIRHAELDYAALQSELQNHYNRHQQPKFPAPATLHQAQASCDSETAIIEYAVTPESLVIFFISSEEVTARQLNLQNLSEEYPSKSLTELVKGFKDAIQSHADQKELDKWSAPLYRLLIKPFEEQLRSYAHLIVVPDGPLAHLPFEALRDNGTYLIQNFDIKYVPSVTSLGLLNDPRGDQPNQLLAVAGSGLTEGVPTPNPQRNFLYTALPATLAEVDSVASNFSRTVTLKNHNLSEQALKQLLTQEYRFVHLATHGIIDEQNPANSSLLVSNHETETSQEDGFLKSSEVYELTIPSDMVVLSACSSGLGKIINGEGMLGLQRSFFHAGASTVVVSLWNVYDRSTAYLMDQFYKAIIAQDAESYDWLNRFSRWVGWNQSIPFGNAAKAMRAAKLKLLDHSRFNHPVYWAPFIVVGR